MRSRFELWWLSEGQTKESTATHIPWSVCRDAKEEFGATRTNRYSSGALPLMFQDFIIPLHVYHSLSQR